MPSLTWIGKDAVLNHHLDVPYRVLEKKYDFGDGEPGNKIIHGDNLEALKSLLPEYEGRVKCIYIDPPYNTGEENWVYNDNVNSPKVRKWLGEVVGKESEDLTRHDKWLCMMYPRLKLLQKLLSNDGAIFISIDDHEQVNLKMICDEIFGPNNFLSEFIWEKRTSRENRKVFSVNHDYVLAYAKIKKSFESQRGCLPYTTEVLKRYSNPDDDPRGAWQSVALTVQGGHGTKTQFYTITTPSGRCIDPPSGLCWRFTEQKLTELIADNRITFGNDGNNVPRLKLFLEEMEQGLTPHSLWKSTEVETTDNAKREILEIFDGKAVFDTPKPTKLIERILQIASKQKDFIVLDSFAGSGTTAHAVLNLNRLDGGNRKFILVEMEKYAESITAERVRRVIKGYKSDVQNELYSKELTIKDIKRGSEIVKELDNVRDEHKKDYDKFESVIEDKCLKLLGVKKGECEGTGGSFSYYELGPELLKDGFINEDVPEQTIREYLYYTETNHVLPQSNNGHPAHLGNFEGVAYYFLYNKDETTTLDATFLASISEKADRYVIYADNCIMPQKFLFDHDITFKKIPRDIRRF